MIVFKNSLLLFYRFINVAAELISFVASLNGTLIAELEQVISVFYICMGLFYFFNLFIHLEENEYVLKLPMAGFKPLSSSSVGSDHSPNCNTTTTQSFTFTG